MSDQRWIESNAEGHILPISDDAEVPEGWTERSDLRGRLAK